MHSKPATASEALAQMESLLDQGKPQDAARHFKNCGLVSPELRDAYGVALMRSGETARALEHYISLCVGESGYCLKPNLPATFKANYATALLLARNVAGCRALLREMGAPCSPYVQKLQRAIERWRRSLHWWHRLSLDWYGAHPDAPIPLDFEPGEVPPARIMREDSAPSRLNGLVPVR